MTEVLGIRTLVDAVEELLTNVGVGEHRNELGQDRILYRHHPDGAAFGYANVVPTPSAAAMAAVLGGMILVRRGGRCLG